MATIIKKNNYDISVLVPGIRTHNWNELFLSTQHPTLKVEVIFVGPFEPPEELKDKCVYIKDHGSPIRCQQIALLKAQGRYVTWAADDGTFFTDILRQAYEVVYESTPVTAKYIEGSGSDTLRDEYYNMHYHPCTAQPYIGQDYKYLNVGLVSRQVLLDLGGWDCQFEACPMSHADLAVRLQNAGYRFLMLDQPLFVCSHTPGTSGDHGPIHYAQTQHDEPLFKKIYSDPSSKLRVGIQDNHQDSPSVWTRRFNPDKLASKYNEL